MHPRQEDRWIFYSTIGSLLKLNNGTFGAGGIKKAKELLDTELLIQQAKGYYTAGTVAA